MKNAVIGIFAHVDAGKTTLSEGILYKTGVIRRLGRVDNGDAYLDWASIEKERGITVFAGQADFTFRDMGITLLDTPGHVDFSAETERIMQVIDCAVLVISGTDGVQSHTRTLFKLLGHYGVPVFIFVTKTDLERKTKEELLKNIREELSENTADFSQGAQNDEELSLCDEEALEKYLENGSLCDSDVSRLILSRKAFPCYFGSGLKLLGIDELLDGIYRFLPEKKYPEKFGAQVFKITRDKNGAKLVHLKITGGTLRVRDTVTVGEKEEKISSIRICSGAKSVFVDEVSAGRVCTVTGLESAKTGLSLGDSFSVEKQTVESVMNYRLLLPKEVDSASFLPKLKTLEEEDPVLGFTQNSRTGEIYVKLMGEVQREILKAIIEERFNVSVDTDKGSVIYKETIKNKVEGVGHYEPLRHYAEVHVIMEPLPRGAGLVFEAQCREDMLDRDFQRLILTHLKEKQHLGVLTGSPVTDIKFTLAAGRAHIKHTEGGDFRQASYRAVRQGLMKAESVLLEPYYSFKLEVPREKIGRAISDIKAMHGAFSSPEDIGGFSVLSGTAPVTKLNGYASVVAVYTGGNGRLSLSFDGYKECHNTCEVIKSFNYDPEADLENTPDSVFCAHGGGFTVKWRDTESYMHIESCLKKEKTPYEAAFNKRNFSIDDKELEAIMEREFGKARLTQTLYRTQKKKETESTAINETPLKTRCTIVDGYNVIFSWEELKELAKTDLGFARKKLSDILSEYAAFTKNKVILVFDAYNVPGGTGEREQYGNIYTVFTKENETGDMYIEKLVSDIGKNENVRVVTSDGLIQLSSLRFGVLRMSSSAFFDEVMRAKEEMRDVIELNNGNN